MNPYRLETTTPEILRDPNNLTYLAMGSSMRFGFRTSADLFVAATKNYDPHLSAIALATTLHINTARKFVSVYGISCESDIFFYIRHPEKAINVPDKVSAGRCRRRILTFTPPHYDPYFDDIEKMKDLDVETLRFVDEDHKKAYLLLLKHKPRERGFIVQTMIEQYLITSINDYYYLLSAKVLFNYFVSKARSNENGLVILNEALVKEAKSIWNLANIDSINERWL